MQHNPAKITLSKDELELVTNAQILLTKNDIIKKVFDLFGELAEAYVIAARDVLPQEVRSITPKISRGENYLGLPYVMLDYPRFFQKEEMFAIRTFFWWGNFFSLTLQLSGGYQNRSGPSLQEAISSGYFEGWFINDSIEMWDHHFEETNYKPVTITVELSNKKFIKLATKIPLQEWDNASLFLLESFNKLIKVLHV